jgi:hypothetical protein
MNHHLHISATAPELFRRTAIAICAILLCASALLFAVGAGFDLIAW